jgi:hypothetical protein
MGGSSTECSIFQDMLVRWKEEEILPRDFEKRVYDVISLLSKEQRKDFWNLYEQGYITVDFNKIWIKGDIWSYFAQNLSPEELKWIYLQASVAREVKMGVKIIMN